MSANNFILIDRNSLEVSLRDAGTSSVLEKIGRAITLDQAIDIAQDYQEREIIEYGIQFTKRRKERNAK